MLSPTLSVKSCTMLLGGALGIENWRLNAGGFGIGVRGLVAPDNTAWDPTLVAVNSGRVGVIGRGAVCVGVDAPEPSPRTAVSGRNRDAMTTLCANRSHYLLDDVLSCSRGMDTHFERNSSSKMASVGSDC